MPNSWVENWILVLTDTPRREKKGIKILKYTNHDYRQVSENTCKTILVGVKRGDAYEKSKSVSHSHKHVFVILIPEKIEKGEKIRFSPPFQ